MKIDVLRKLRRRMDRMYEKHETEVKNMKQKQEFTVLAMFVLFSAMMNMVMRHNGPA